MAVAGENQYIYAIHEPGGEHLMKVGNEARGWIVFTEALYANPNNHEGTKHNYQQYADQGFGVVVRLNHDYGENGTIPRQALYRDFSQRVANFVKNSPGAHIWIIGNEMNLAREQPRIAPGSNEREFITPLRYAECYVMCRRAIKSLRGHENDQVVVGPIGPWNPETPYDAHPQGIYPENRINGNIGDYIIYLRDILNTIGRENCDAICIHAYTHGYDPQLIFSEDKMDPPFHNYNFHFRTYQDQLNIIPQAFRDLPIYLTETNGDDTWPNVNSGWVKNAMHEVNEWNKQPGNQQIRCVALYRWPPYDKWNLNDKDQVHRDLQESVSFGYTWKEMPDVRPPVVVDPPAVSGPKYRTNFISHNVPSSVTTDRLILVTVQVENAGSDTWTTSGSPPYQLGFQWYDAQSQFKFAQQFRLPHDVAPGQSFNMTAQVSTPDTGGQYYLRADMIHGPRWFTGQGDKGQIYRVTVQLRRSLSPQPVSSTRGIGMASADPSGGSSTTRGIGMADATRSVSTTPVAKTIRHYMLLWHDNVQAWGEWDLRGAINYIAVFTPTIGFSIEEAKYAQYVTIVGDTTKVPVTVEAQLVAAGCQVGRVAGTTEQETRQLLDRLASQRRRF